MHCRLELLCCTLRVHGKRETSKTQQTSIPLRPVLAMWRGSQPLPVSRGQGVALLGQTSAPREFREPTRQENEWQNFLENFFGDNLAGLCYTLSGFGEMSNLQETSVCSSKDPKTSQESPPRICRQNAPGILAV